MPVKAILTQGAKGEELLSAAFNGEQPVLVCQSIGQAFGVFKSVTETTEGTYSMATVLAGEAIVLTDILISAAKKALSSLTLTLTDGVDSETIFTLDTISNPISFAAALQGRWQGWSGASLNVTSVADVVFTVAIGYYRVDSLETFATWDAKR